MRFRFTIRDLLWLTLVVAILAGWWLDRRNASSQRDGLELEFKREAIHNRVIIERIQKWWTSYKADLDEFGRKHPELQAELKARQLPEF